MTPFSPSPAPRRTVARHTTPHTPRTPPVVTARRPRPSRPVSRFTTPLRNTERAREDDSVVSGMDVDEVIESLERGPKTETVFAKTQEFVVNFYAHLPVEVKQVLKNADFYCGTYTGDIDASTGYALVASTETCFVWQYAQALTGTPTCYIFACPADAVPTPMTAPFHALVPYGPPREPGLIISSPRGHIRLWESLGIGLAGGEQYSTLHLELDSDEIVTSLMRADTQTYILSTSNGRLFRLSLTSTGGKYHLSTRSFNHPRSVLSLSLLFPKFWSSQSIQPVLGNINAIALSHLDARATGWDMWCLVETRIQRWNISLEGWEEAKLDEDVAELVRVAVRESSPSAPLDDIEMDLELLDLKVERAGNLVILISYAAREEDRMIIDTGIPQIRRIYAIVRLMDASGSFKVEKVTNVPYQSTSSSGAPMHPRIQLMSGGKLVVAQFGDAVTICARDTEYMDRLELKSATNRTLGVGVIDDHDFLVLTATTIMRTYVDEEQVANFNLETGRANLIKSVMTQAILYGSNPENPLHFSFPPEVDEDALMVGAEQLSKAVLESDLAIVQPHHDLQSQMTSRKDRLGFLIKFINDNAVLTKISQRTRQTLEADAGKIYAAHQLWLRHNELIGADEAYNILNEAVYAYMHAVGEGHHEDFLRAFFRLKVDDVAGLFPHVLDIVRGSARELTRSLSETVPQANRIALTILQSATDCREFNLGVYGIEYPLINPWTSQPAVIDFVMELFETTTALVQGQSDNNRSKSEPKAQLPELAAALFGCIQERLEWLRSPIAIDQMGATREYPELEEKFRQLRPEVLETLRRNNFTNEAFKLAEDHQDFRNLAALCHQSVVYPPQDNPYALRIQAYVDKFKENFTTELYQWYIEHGELRALFAPHQSGDYIDTFFAEHPYPRISWIHDLGRGRYGPASQCLLMESEHIGELTAKHFMLSVGKLSYLAQLHEDDTVIEQSVLDSFHNGLDFVSVHEVLVEDLKSPLASIRARQSLDQQVETILRAKASVLGDRKALQNGFKYLVRQLLTGKALSVEDISDVLSLKDNKTSPEDYATALQLLSQARNIPEARKLVAFRSVWRRIYNHDEWDNIRQTVNVSDDDLNDRFRNTALYVALQATTSREYKPNGYILLPSQAMEAPKVSEISSRWPGMSADELDALERDYKSECDKLRNLEIEEMFERVRLLVEGDAERQNSS